MGIPEGAVRIVFHRYTGFLLTMRQERIDAILPFDDAETALRQARRHNLTRGLLGPGAVFVPILALFEFRSQMKKVQAAREEKQVA